MQLRFQIPYTVCRHTQVFHVTDLILKILAVMLVVAGIFGTLIPALPGSLLVLGGLVLIAWVDNFATIGWGTIGVLVAITALTFLVDFLASAHGTRKMGASTRAIWGATLGAFVGMFFGLPGFLFGPFIGAMAAQLSADRDLIRAGKVGFGAWMGMVVGIALKLALVFLMIGICAVAAFI